MKWLLRFLEAELQLEQIVREAQNAEGKADFIHKFKISAKEADELEYYINPKNELLTDLKSIIKIINKIISTSKKN